MKELKSTMETQEQYVKSIQNYEWYHKNFQAYHAQRKQHKIKNISFILQRQHIHPNLMTDTILTFEHTTHKGNNVKFRIFSFKLYTKPTTQTNKFYG